MRIDRFSTADHIKKKDRTYEAVRDAVLAAGRFSAFEAGEDPHTFNRICRDPELVIDHSLGYPWVGVTRKIEGRS